MSPPRHQVASIITDDDVVDRNHKNNGPPSAISGLSQADLDKILSGRLALVDLRVRNNNNHEVAIADSLSSARRNDKYAGVYASFCHVDWSGYKQDPSTYGMFRIVVEKSPACSNRNNWIQGVPLYELVQHVRQYDATNTSSSSSGVKVLDFTAAVFHESRCGSTLVANLLTALDPVKHRVYSESAAPVAALHSVCGDDYEHCTKQTAAAIFKDVVYLMSRSNDINEQRVFFKIQSIGSRHIEVFQLAFPDTPYLFVYRDPVQVLMSQLKYGKHKANCVHAQERKVQPSAITNIVKKYATGAGRKNPRNLSSEDYCAAHLATLTESVVNKFTDKGIPVNYEDLPDALYHDIFPNALRLTVDETALANMQAVAALYSKGHGDEAQEFQQDSETKDKAASPKIRDAAETFLSSSYAALEALAVEKRKKQ